MAKCGKRRGERCQHGPKFAWSSSEGVELRGILSVGKICSMISQSPWNELLSQLLFPDLVRHLRHRHLYYFYITSPFTGISFALVIFSLELAMVIVPYQFPYQISLFLQELTVQITVITSLSRLQWSPHCPAPRAGGGAQNSECNRGCKMQTWNKYYIND